MRKRIDQKLKDQAFAAQVELMIQLEMAEGGDRDGVEQAAVDAKMAVAKAMGEK